MPCERLLGDIGPQPEGRPHVEINGELVPLRRISSHDLPNFRGRPIFGDEERGLLALFPDGYKLPEDPKIGQVIFIPEGLNNGSISS